MSGRATIQMGIRVSRPERRAIQIVCDEQSVSQSELFRRAIQDYLARVRPGLMDSLIEEHRQRPGGYRRVALPVEDW